MESTIKKYSDFINESISPENFVEFSENRLKGATKIASSAKEKGGDALLTYHHFNVKLPYYEKASEGKFDFEKSEREYQKNLGKLVKLTSEGFKISQTDFQELVGVIEVLGELAIKQKSNK